MSSCVPKRRGCADRAPRSWAVIRPSVGGRWGSWARPRGRWSVWSRGACVERGSGSPEAGCLAAGGASAEPIFQRGGAEQAAYDAGDDQRDVSAAEDCGNEAEAGEEVRDAGVQVQGISEASAVDDTRVNDAEHLGDARGHGPIGMELDGCDRGGGGGHGGIKT